MLPQSDNAAAETETRKSSKLKVWLRVIKRSLILFGLGLFMNGGYYYKEWRIPGVLQYFAVSYFVTSATVLLLYSYTQDRLQLIHDQIRAQEHFHQYSANNNRNVEAHDSTFTSRHPIKALCSALFCGCSTPTYLSGYSLEWVLQGLLLATYLIIVFLAKSPDCPAGYNGAGGIMNHGDNFECTGGIHRYIDGQVMEVLLCIVL
jgi:heparan-alpha-glucosaminide N-acetyltransferase